MLTIRDVSRVFTEGPTPACHAATIAVVAGGDEVVAWFGGAREGAKDVAIWSSVRPAGGAWSPPALAARARDVPCWNPVLHPTPDGRVLLFYKVGPSPQTWSGRVTTSTDGGRTWGDRAPLPPGILGPIKNKPLALDGGQRLLCPSSTESHLAWGAWFEDTDVHLTSWGKHGPVHLPGIGIIQPALFAGDGPDHVVALCRTANAGRVARTESTDAGRTWTVPALVDVPHNNSGLDAVRLEDGRVVLVANAVERGRSPLHVLVSHDLGRTFGSPGILDATAGELSYPSVVATGADEVRVVDTTQRRHIAHCRAIPRS